MQTPRSIAVWLVWLVCMGSACIPSALQPRVSYEANPQVLQSSGFVIFQDSTGALSYHAPVGRDVRKLVSTHRVRGRACQRGLQLPIAPFIAAFSSTPLAGPASLSVTWGDGGYSDAMEEARRGLPYNAVLYDVRADLATMQILSIYRQSCVELNAAVAMPLPAAEMAPSTSPVTPPPAAEPAPSTAPAPPPPAAEPAPSTAPAPPPPAAD